MKTIDIITPVSRPQNLPVLYRSIEQSLIPDLKINWIIVVDKRAVSSNIFEYYNDYFSNIKNESINVKYHGIYHEDSRFGNAQRNFALTIANSEWIYFLDDDTTIHPELFYRTNEDLNDKVDLIMVSQTRDPLEFPFVELLTPNINNIRSKGIGNIDTGQVIYRASLLHGDGYYPIDFYQADGALVQRICNKVQDNKAVILTEVLCIYNSLR